MKKFFFYFITSSTLALAVFYMLWFIVPMNCVFGFPMRMAAYHYDHPVAYILIPCFFYSVLASLVADYFRKAKILKRILLTILIVLMTVLLSCPFGGMLWNFHDMQAGYFPNNWMNVLFVKAPVMGLEWGFLIIASAIPYNLIGTVICYFLTLKGGKMFQKDVVSN
jgi:hypothetical protein